VELSEVWSRIFGRHRVLVIAFVLLGLGGGLAVHWSDKPNYRASTRLLASSTDPSTSNEAVAIADTMRALATGPSLIRKALGSIGVNRDPAEVAGNIDVRGLGSSGVVELQVSDRDPSVALRLTKAIGAAVVSQRVHDASNTTRHAISALRTQVKGFKRQIAHVDRELSAVNANAGSIDPSVANRAIADREQLLAQRTGLSEQLTVLTSKEADLTSLLAAPAPAAMIDPPAGPAELIKPQRFPDLLLGGLLGLILGVAAAGVLETIRPTVVGRAAIARSLQTAVLGELRRSGGHWNLDDVLEAASHIGLAAAGSAVKRVDLLSTSAHIDVPRLASAVGDELTHLSVEVATPATIVGLVVSGGDAAGPARTAHRGRPAPDRGLVLVVPEAVKQADLEPARDFIAISGWPLLGVIIAHRSNALALVRRDSNNTALTSEASA